MPELSPDDSLPIDCRVWTPSGAIPASVRTFGRFFDCQDWWPGDVVLTRSVTPDALSSGIVEFQTKAGYGATDAQWIHAAVYLGDGQRICEATRKGVMISPLYNYCGKHVIKVRRSRHLPDRESGWQVAMHVVSHLARRYGYREIVRMGKLVRGRKGFWLPLGNPFAAIRRGIICSSLFADAHNYVTGITIAERTNGTCVPAFLSQTEQLFDIPGQWARLASAGIDIK